MKNLKIDNRLVALKTSSFRANFRLHSTEKAMAIDKGLPVIREHAHDLIAKRLAPAQPKSDGKQTPYRGHPVFVAQHATATCCRTCLERWHRLGKGRELTASEQNYVVDIIEAWIQRELLSKA